MTIRTFHYAYRHELEDWARLGWLPRSSILDGHPLSGRSVMVEWLCDCTPVRPARLENRPCS